MKGMPDGMPEVGPAVEGAARPMPAAPSAFLGHQTAKKAVQILLELNQGFHEPSRLERNALLVGFAMHQRVLYGAAFDVVRLSEPVDLTDPEAIAGSIDAIDIYEIKSTNRPTMDESLKGYFFNITAAELLVAQSLGSKYRFVFVNTMTGSWQEKNLAEVFGSSRAIYPAWHIRF